MDDFIIEQLPFGLEIKQDEIKRFTPDQMSRYTVSGHRFRLLPKHTHQNYSFYCPHTFMGRHLAFIFTKEQADELGISYYDDWRDKSEGDWVITEIDSPFDTFWVMQLLKVNNNKSFPYVKTAVGSFAKKGRIMLNANDRRNWNNVGYGLDYTINRGLTQRNKAMCLLLASYLRAYGRYDETTVKMAYNRTHESKCNPFRARQILRNELVQNEVAKNVKELIDKKKMGEDWVLDQLKKVGEDVNHKHWLTIIVMVAKMNGIEVDNFMPLPEPKRTKSIGSGLEDAEYIETLENK